MAMSEKLGLTHTAGWVTGTTEMTQSCTWNAGLLFKIIMNKNTRDSRLEKVQAR
jgi:hypothetical protein